MYISGTIKMIGQQKIVGQSFRKREAVITTDEQYPQMILVEFAQDKCDLLDNFGHGQKVKIFINIRGREWTSPQGEIRYFNSIQGWKIEGESQQVHTTANSGYGSAVDAYQNRKSTNNTEQTSQQRAQSFEPPRQREMFNGNSEPSDPDDLPF